MRTTGDQDAESDDEIRAYYRTLLTLHRELTMSDTEQDRIEAIGVRYAIELLEAHHDHIPDDD